MRNLAASYRAACFEGGAHLVSQSKIFGVD